MPKRTSAALLTAAPSDLISSIAAAKILNITPSRLRQLAQAGRITAAMRIPPRGDRLYSRADVEHFARARKSKPA